MVSRHTSFTEMVRFTMPHSFRPPSRLEIFALVVWEFHLLFRLNHLDPCFDYQFAGCLLESGETCMVVVVNGVGSKSDRVHGWSRGRLAGQA